MPLTILSVAFPFAPVGPAAVGGAEQVLGMIDAGLVRAGHRSIVIACEGSRIAGELIAAPAVAGPLTDARKREAWGAYRALIDRAIADHHPDLVHAHGVDFHAYLPEADAPLLVTLHLPADSYPAHALRPTRPRTFLHPVSASQRRRMPPGIPLLPEIENGVAIASRPGEFRRRGFALSAGRICPEKNIHAAIDAAERAGVPLLIAGTVFPYEEHQRYFLERIAPRLNRRCRLIGPVGGDAKRRLFSSARCVLAPSVVEETSSLIAMEALSCGTPVIAYRRGALPEIVDHGRTGFVVDDVGSMAAAIHRADSIDPAACRDTARRRFSAARMIDRYLACYRSILGAASASPRARAARRPAPRYRSGVITSTAGIERLRAEWDALWSRIPSAAPFVSPRWLIPWWRHFGRGAAAPLLITLRDRRTDRLAALAPLYICTDPATARRKVLLLGVGTGDYADALAEPGYEDALWSAVLDSLEAARDHWDVCDLGPLRPNSLLAHRSASLPWRADAQPGEPSPILALSSSVEAFHTALPANIAQNLRYYRRRAARAGAAVERAAGPAVVDALDALIRLHAARWAGRAGGGVLSDPAVIAWHRESLPDLDRAGLARLHLLRLDGRPIAAHYILTDAPGPHRHWYLYLTGFDPAYAPLSPGTLLLAHAAEEAVRDGAAALDLLRGREMYKYLWGATDTATIVRSLRLGPPAAPADAPHRSPAGVPQEPERCSTASP